MADSGRKTKMLIKLKFLNVRFRTIGLQTPKPCKKYSRAYHDAVVSAGGINASIKDMAKFLQLWLGGFPAVAKSEDLDPFINPVTEAPDALPWFGSIKKKESKSSYAYGWRVIDIDDERIIFHGGFLSGFMNFVAFSPKKQLGIVILNNVESSFGLQTATKFLRGDFEPSVAATTPLPKSKKKKGKKLACK